MWNILFKKAYNDNCDYFYQCGDDILFKTKGWNNLDLKDKIIEYDYKDKTYYPLKMKRVNL